MSSEELCKEILRFVGDFYPQTNHARRVEHLRSEVDELAEACCGKSRIEEAADVALICFHVMLAESAAADPVGIMAAKLAEARRRIESGQKKPRPFVEPMAE